jgi:hypothetical protein
LSINGTHQDDSFFVSAQNGFSVSVNGMEYHFDHDEINNVQVSGHRGHDSINVVLGNDDDRVNTRVDGLSVSNQHWSFNSFGLENINVVGGGGYDVASMLDSVGNDRLTSGSNSAGDRWVTLAGTNFRGQVSGFDVVYVRGSGGLDQASVVGTAGDDLFVSRGSRNILRTTGSTLLFDNFDSVSVLGGGGNDTANLNDSSANDRFVLAPRSGSISNENYTVSVSGFARINAFSKTGQDSVTTRGSAGDDVFFHREGIGVLRGNGYLNFTQGFANVDAFSGGGLDIAQMFDTSGNDQYFVNVNSTTLVASGLRVSASGFWGSHVIANAGGSDRVSIQGTAGADRAEMNPDRLRVVMSNGRTSHVRGAEEIQLDMRGGNDSALLTGTSGRELLTARFDEIEFETTLQMLRMTNVEHTNFDGNGGADEVIFDELGELDLLESLGDRATVYMQNHSVTAEDFALLEARSVDDAIAQYDLEAVDFLYMLRGRWAPRR